MIWAIVSKAEMDSFGSNHVIGFYSEVIGRNNIQLAVIDETDELDFVNSDDVVLLRTASRTIIETIKRKGLVSTAEDYMNYRLVADKVNFSNFLISAGVKVPRQYRYDEIEEGKAYFVKPRFGCDSNGISPTSICHTKLDVKRQVARIKDDLLQDVVIEDFIDGKEYTVACIKQDGSLNTYAVEVDCSKTNGIQVRDCKVGFMQYLTAVNDNTIKGISCKVFNLMSLKHHARIDFRKDLNGELYVIDVNLLPGLGPINYFARCLLLSRNISYTDTIKMVINTATTF